MSDSFKIYSPYICLFIGVVVGFFPDMDIQSISALIVYIALTLAYCIRKRAVEDDLVWHHATFVIRTVWIWSLFALIALIGAGYQIYIQGDSSMIDAFMQQVLNGAIPDETQMDSVWKSYMSTNSTLITSATLLWMGSAQVYALWRIYKGLSRAKDGYRVQNLRGWF